MKVSSILKQAGKCKTAADAEDLLMLIQNAFSNASPVAHLAQQNEVSYIEADGALTLSFELVRLLSSYYAIEIRPNIVDGEFEVQVALINMVDGYGIFSKQWNPVEGLEETIKAKPEQSIYMLAKLAKLRAIAIHGTLIERIGIPIVAARLAAKKNW